MKRTVWLWQFFGFAVTALSGTLLHFLYEWLGEGVWIAPFSGVNESTWEHMKLLFWPIFIFAVIQYFFFKNYGGFWCVKLRGTLLGLSLIPVIFYTYNGVIGKSPDWVNILIFFIAAAAIYIYEAKRLISNDLKCKSQTAAFTVLLTIGMCFIVFTFRTPALGIFKDPITGAFGM